MAATLGLFRGRGKSGLHKATVPGNARPGQPEGKRHREQTTFAIRLRIAWARVKRWGKSPPRDGQPDRQGKPHREQCRIGTACGPALARRSGLAARACWQQQAQRNGHRRAWPGTKSGLQALRAVYHIAGNFGILMRDIGDMPAILHRIAHQKPA